jgi:hypothetical protein
VLLSICNRHTERVEPLAVELTSVYMLQHELLGGLARAREEGHDLAQKLLTVLDDALQHWRGLTIVLACMIQDHREAVLEVEIPVQTLSDRLAHTALNVLEAGLPAVTVAPTELAEDIVVADLNLAVAVAVGESMASWL